LNDTDELQRRVTELVGVELGRLVATWVEADPDETTRTEVLDLVATGDAAGLQDRFGARLQFGTAGLRGELGAGPNRMNRLVVRHAAAGLVAHLGDGAQVVIGFDARHGSAAFAEDTARVVAAAGGRALVLPGPCPTPVVPFAVRHLGVDVGVMVTASHNPPRDNGHKVYLRDGGQIVPPVDAEVAAAIERASHQVVLLADPRDPAIVRLDESVFDAYLDVVERCRFGTEPPRLGVVYTAMHGVGRDLTVAAFGRLGFPTMHQVAEQVEPDPDFPTVAFPNPEEPGALDLSLALAVEVGADLVIAHDPDADRLGVAVPTADGWRALTGNEIGVLLADHVLANTRGDDRVVATTMVSSRLLSRLATAAGVRYVDTLTGFKWIARAADAAPGGRLVFGYEEALGYAVTPEVRDKDGITAAVTFVELAGRLASDGRTVLDRLDELAIEHGLHETFTWAVRFDGPDARARMDQVMAAIRASTPETLAGLAVTEVVDYLPGGPLPPTDAVAIVLGSSARVVVRPSGTEPKAKLYLEVVSPTTADGLAADRLAARALLGEIRADLARLLHLPVD
jgi:phosphomannomutase